MKKVEYTTPEDSRMVDKRGLQVSRVLNWRVEENWAGSRKLYSRTAEYWKERQLNIGQDDSRILNWCASEYWTAAYWIVGLQNIGGDQQTIGLEDSKILWIGHQMMDRRQQKMEKKVIRILFWNNGRIVNWRTSGFLTGGWQNIGMQNQDWRTAEYWTGRQENIGLDSSRIIESWTAEGCTTGQHDIRSM
jgi:hypothetical protein